MKRLVGLALLFFSAGALFGAPVPCPSVTTVGALKALSPDGCISGDKIYTNFTSDIANSVAAFQILFEPGGGIPDNHGWNIISTFGVGTYNFGYTISVAPGFPALRIATAQIDASGGTGAEYTASGSVDGGLYVLNISQSSTSALVGLAPLLTTLSIADRLVVTRGPVNGFENTFTQLDTSIPEPGTMVLFGSALLAVGCLGLRRRS